MRKLTLHRLARSFALARPALSKLFMAACVFALSACDATQSEPTVPVLLPPGQVERMVGGSEQSNVNQVAVTIYTPAPLPDDTGARMRGNVLVLPGWKYDRRRWLRETPIKRLADKHRLRLIAPEMGRSIYAAEYYPETGARWNPEKPGLAWILEDLLPYLAEQGVFREGQANFLLGLSTGGRGVAQIALARPELITAASALSGDFDQTLQTGDRLIARQARSHCAADPLADPVRQYYSRAKQRAGFRSRTAHARRGARLRLLGGRVGALV